MTLDLRKYFTREAIAKSLQSLPELSTPVIDLLFPEANRVNHPLPTIGVDDLGLPSGNIPVVRRGSPSIGLKPDDGKLSLIEPQPVSGKLFLDATTINSMTAMSGEGVQQLINNRINSLRQVVRQTAEALSAQVLTGKINYPMKSDGANLSYQVDYGTPTAVTVTKKWDDAATKIADIIKSCGEIIAAMRVKGFGRTVVFLVDFDVYAALVDKIGAVANSGLVSVDVNGIQIGTLKFMLLPASYTDFATGTLVSGIPAKKVVAIDLAAGHKLFYASVDDLDANFQGLPFFSKIVKKDDPSGYDIIGQAKPLPVVNVKGIVTASVLT